MDISAFDWGRDRPNPGRWHGGEAVLDFGDPRRESETLAAEVAVVPLAGRTQLEITGRDRASWLHNLCTNEIKKLTPGAGCEAFITNVQGKLVGHVLVFCREEALVVETVPGQAERLMNHLEKYHIREDVEVFDRTANWTEFLVAGPRAGELWDQLGRQAPSDNWSHVEAEIQGVPVQVRRVDWTLPPAWLLSAAATDGGAIWKTLRDAGGMAGGQTALEAARIEAGWPWFGVDLSDQNLAQEADRDRRAICFTKGCYLGQETVARIDALGHVNRTLCRLHIDGDALPSPGTELRNGEAVVGRITSAALRNSSPGCVALALVKQGSSQPHTQLTCQGVRAEVLASTVR